MSDKVQENSAVELSVQPENTVSFIAGANPDSISLPGFHSFVLIASGASGFVYSAVRDSDNRSVAVKIFQKDLTPDSDSIRRFQHEVATLTKLSHPSIVKILGAGTARDGASYIVMEKIEGESLRAILDRTGAFAPKQAVAVVREICRALTAAHESGVIHRDLKPNNVILDGKGIAKIVDFGVAKAVGSSTDTITQYGAIIGTPAYMSPEQCLGKAVDARSDVYSLGCILYELLTNFKAFEAETAMAALAKQISPDRNFLTIKFEEANVPRDLQAIVLRCLARDPALRFDSAAALDHELSAYLLQIPNSKNSSWESSQWFRVTAYALSVIALLILFEAAVWNARLNVESFPSQSISTMVFPARASRVGEPVSIDVKNRMTGKTIYSETAPGLTLAKVLQNASDKGISFEYADLNRAKLIQANLRGVDLRKADLTDASLIQSNLTDVKLDGAIMTGAKMIQANLTRCTLRDARMSSTVCTQMRAPYTVLAGVDFSNSKLGQARLMNCDMRGANFTGAYTIQTNFYGSDITDANFSIPERKARPDLQGCLINGVTLR